MNNKNKTNMGNIVEFILKLKDQMSAPMRGITTMTARGFNAIDKGIAGSQSKVNRLGVSLGGMNKRLDDLKKTREISIDDRQIKRLNRQIRDIEHNINRVNGLGLKGGSSGGSLLGLGALGISGLGVGGALMGAGKLANMGMQDEARRASFDVMGGKGGAGLYSSLTKFAQESIFGNEVYQNAQTMLAFGASVKDVLPDLKMLGDISMGNKDRLGSLTLAFSQIRSTGRLMGQDLLQLVNAGFNPLQIISEKTGRSMAKLKKDMEGGKIPFSMVQQAFKDATSEGGRFYNMTNKIADTTFGKWEAAKGQLAGIGIQLGTSLMPYVSSLIGAANATTDFLGITMKVPERLMGEKLEINSLVTSITKLNQGNKLRGDLIDMLKTKAPDMFGNLDRENTLNEKLLGTLSKVNAQYDRRMGIATSNLVADNASKDISKYTALAVRARAQAEYSKLDPSFSGRFKYLSRFDRAQMAANNIPFNNTPAGLMGASDAMMGKVQQLQGIKARAENAGKAGEINDLLRTAEGILKNRNAPNRGGILGEVNAINSIIRGSGGKFNSKLYGYDYSKLKGLVSGAGVMPGSMGSAAAGGSAMMGSAGGYAGLAGLDSGSSKTASISGTGKIFNIVIQKVFDTVNIQGGDFDGNVAQMEEKLEGAVMRVLNSLSDKNE